MNAPKSGKNGVALWKALEDAALEDDIDAVLAMSDAELDGYIAANGGDPAAIRAAGEAQAEELFAQRERNEWQASMGAKLGAFRETAAASRRAPAPALPRAELLRRLDVARRDPRFATPVAALFRKKTAEASTDEELQALLEQIELLGTLDVE